ncbi:MAG: DUF2281 domain-containing protein [Methylovulum sp.]|nr:DUF2281 domain-containing protein [Methylovulum sp.]
MNIVELIYQEAKDLPETEAREVLDFVEFLKVKRRRVLESTTKFQHRENGLGEADMSEFDQFGSVYDGHFDRDACYDRPNLR